MYMSMFWIRAYLGQASATEDQRVEEKDVRGGEEKRDPSPAEDGDEILSVKNWPD
jgi:hypothetical protein